VAHVKRETASPPDGHRNKGMHALALSSDIDVRVLGPILRATVTQRFRNDTQVWMEGEYRFPLPEKAGVDQLRIRIGERVIEGQVKEKKVAKKAYQQAKQQGKRASLLAFLDASTFSSQIANIGPGEEVIVEFEYQHKLDYRLGRFSLRLPLVTTPKYRPATQSAVDTHVTGVRVYRGHAQPPANPIGIRVSIDSGVPIALPDSPSHVVTARRVSDKQAEVALEARPEWSNRDFILTWRVRQSDMPTASTFIEEYDGETFGMVMLLPPEWQNTGVAEVQRDLNFVLDVSGSMQGESIRQAKSALISGLQGLQEHDRFNLIWFSDRSAKLFAEAMPATRRNVMRAISHVGNLQAGGGTRMDAALSLAMQRHRSDEHLKQIVFITDGAVNNERQLFRQIENELGSSRLFTVGIGSAPNSFFMQNAARAGRGTYTYINDVSQSEKVIGQLLQSLASPALVNIELIADGVLLAESHASGVDVTPNPLPDLYMGEPLVVFFKAQHMPRSLWISGLFNGRSVSYPVLLHHAQQQAGIAVAWARSKTSALYEDYLLAEGEQKSALRSEIVQLGLRSHQVTPFTSLLAVDVTPVNTSGQLLRSEVPQNLPKGWAGKGKQISLAQTALGLRFKWLLGLACLALALAAYLFLGTKRCAVQ
ncbi:MAG: marine proteobacterial sortase target protein, partial [Oleiphilaceae bacterium]|nr:marine proteobacterial sortase target protein [Oleiphilaceae bacterium]